MSEAEALLAFRERIERINLLTNQLMKQVKQINVGIKDEPDEKRLKNFKAIHEIFIRDVKKLDKLKHDF